MTYMEGLYVKGRLSSKGVLSMEGRCAHSPLTEGDEYYNTNMQRIPGDLVGPAGSRRYKQGD